MCVGCLPRSSVGMQSRYKPKVMPMNFSPCRSFCNAHLQHPHPKGARVVIIRLSRPLSRAHGQIVTSKYSSLQMKNETQANEKKSHFCVLHKSPLREVFFCLSLSIIAHTHSHSRSPRGSQRFFYPTQPFRTHTRASRETFVITRRHFGPADFQNSPELCDNPAAFDKRPERPGCGAMNPPMTHPQSWHIRWLIALGFVDESRTCPADDGTRKFD